MALPDAELREMQTQALLSLRDAELARERARESGRGPLPTGRRLDLLESIVGGSEPPCTRRRLAAGGTYASTDAPPAAPPLPAVTSGVIVPEEEVAGGAGNGSREAGLGASASDAAPAPDASEIGEGRS